MTFQLSKPTRTQIVHSVDRVLLVFIVAVLAYLKTSKDPLGKAALSAAAYAGVVAVFQAILSFTTTL